MRTLFVLRGAPASGKSTWIKENKLEPYTLSTDLMRLMYQSPMLDINGEYHISQNNDKDVWNLVFELLEKRMERGELVIIDATHYKSILINRYRNLLDKYRYRIKIVDFTNITEEELLERNRKREPLKRVPEDVIQKMCIALKDSSEVSKSYEIISPKTAVELIYSLLTPVDLDLLNYQAVVVFGDLHGCYEPLNEYFKAHPFNEETCYIFCGDYLDRGLQNKEVLQFLLSIYKNKNVILLEGNHEKWLRLYAEKSYNVKDFLPQEYNYKDVCLKKIKAQIKDQINQWTKEIRVNNNECEKIKQAKQEQDAVEIYYNFELINADTVIKDKQIINNTLARECVKYEKYLSILEHEELNTFNTIVNIADNFRLDTDKELSFNILNLLTKEYPLQKISTENPVKSREFLDNTFPQIANIDKAEIRQLCRKFCQMSYFTFKGMKYLVTHACVPTMPTMYMSTQDMIKGVGKYEDIYKIEEAFANDEVVQLHGHRNPLKLDAKQQDGRIYNLEGQVEFGGHLRVAIITDEIKVEEYKNNIFKEEVICQEEEKSDIETLKEMLNSKLIQVKNLEDNIISINFTRDAFEKSQWNDLTCTARGLFVNKTNGDIVARSFSKFFNYNQVEATKAPALHDTFKYPIIGYKKENGFLGIISKYQGKVHFFTKSTDQGDYVNWFIGVLCDHYDIKDGELSYTYHYSKDNGLICKTLLKVLQDKLSLLLEEDYSYVFECIDKDNDPHIIKYKENNVYLLEVFKNQLKEEYVDWKTLNEISNRLQVPCKEQLLRFNNWEEFEDWKNKFRHDITQWDCKHEGYVLQDANGFRVKFKSSFYSFWKQMRGIKQILQKGGANKKIYKTKEEIEIVKLMEGIDKDKLKELSIIDIEEMYYNK